jgi:DNA-binding FrmR family transcriptional regulator
VEQRSPFDDRQLDALLERFDRLTEEVRGIRRRLDESDQQLKIVRELASLNESLQALAYAALGTQAPHVRRRRTG